MRRWVNSVVCSTTATSDDEPEPDAADHVVPDRRHRRVPGAAAGSSRSSSAVEVDHRPQRGVALRPRRSPARTARPCRSGRPAGNIDALGAGGDDELALLDRRRRGAGRRSRRTRSSAAVGDARRRCRSARCPSACTSCAPDAEAAVVDALDRPRCSRATRRTTPTSAPPSRRPTTTGMSTSMPDAAALVDAPACARSCRPSPTPPRRRSPSQSSMLRDVERSRGSSRSRPTPLPLRSTSPASAAMLATQLRVLVLELVGTPEAVEEVGDRVHDVVDDLLHRRDRRPGPRCGRSRGCPSRARRARSAPGR